MGALLGNDVQSVLDGAVFQRTSQYGVNSGVRTADRHSRGHADCNGQGRAEVQARRARAG